MNDTETLMGGRMVDARDRATGNTERVFVRQLPIGDLPKLFDAIDDEAATLALYCDRPPQWVAALDLESAERLILAGEELNADFFGRWVQRRLERQAKLFPQTAGALANLVARNLSLDQSAPSPSDPE